MTARLAHHVGLVTGAGSGIGKAIALRLAEEGARVCVQDLSEEKAQATVAAIEGAGGLAIAVSGDVSKADDVDAAFATCREALGNPSLVVNNAGIVQQIRFADMQDDDWDRMIGVHLRGTYLCSRRALEPMAGHRVGCDREHCLAIGANRRGGVGPLQRGQGWDNRPDQGAGARSQRAGRTSQRRGAGADQHGIGHGAVGGMA